MKSLNWIRRVACLVAVASAPLRAQAARPELLLRLDDVGMNHSVNTAIKRVAESGIPFSASVLVVCPWFHEAVEILSKHPQISVGVHLALNSEWQSYRWGPVLGRSAVPSLVDTSGYFLPSTNEFLAHKYDLAEVERELDAQIQRAMRSGLRVDYVDYHMGTAVSTPELRAIVERLAAKYKVGVSRYFAEVRKDLWGLPINVKRDSLAAFARRIQPGAVNLAVIHVAEATPEMNALVDKNAAQMNSPTGEPLSGKHRQAELDAVLSSELAAVARERGIKFITYRDVIAAKGLASMKRAPD
jgi:chitin disaccharide deacetylase